MANHLQTLVLSAAIFLYYYLGTPNLDLVPEDPKITKELYDKTSVAFRDFYADPEFITVNGYKVFVKEKSKDSTNKCTVLFHGFPTSSFDYDEFMQKADGYVLTFDFIGFGYSDKPNTDYYYGIQEHADVALEVLRQKLGDRKSCTFVSHDMGDTVLTEILARKQRKVLPAFMDNVVGNVIFTNGGMFYKYIDKRAMQILLASSYGHVVDNIIRKLPMSVVNAVQRKQLKSIFSPAACETKETEQYIHDITYMNRHIWTGSGASGSQLIKYLNDRDIYEYRWHKALEEIDIPCKLVWGDSDAVAPKQIAREIAKLNSNIQLTWLKDTGHFWMVERSWDEYHPYFQ